MWTNYIEGNIEEDIDIKNKFWNKKITCLIKNRDAAIKSYVDSGLIYRNIIRNNAHVDFNDEILDNVRFVKVNSRPAVRKHLTPNCFVDETLSHSVDVSSLLGVDPNEKLEIDERYSKFLNSFLTSPKTIIEKPTNLYVDSLHDTIRNRQDLSSVFNDQDKDFVANELFNLVSVTVNRNPNSDNQLANKKYVNDSIWGRKILRFN